MNADNAARVLLIADDPQLSEQYATALKANGFVVRQAASFVETLKAPMPDLDVIVLCNLAVMAHPGQSTHVIRAGEGTLPAALVREVHRRVALRASLRASMAAAA